MSLTVWKRPATTDFVPGFNPLVYFFQRRDYTPNGSTTSGTKLKVTFNGVDLTAVFTVGSTFQVITSGVDNSKGIKFTVATSTFTAGNTEIVTVEDRDYRGFLATASWVNTDTRKNYYIKFKLYQSAGVRLVTEFQLTTDAAGRARIDVSDLIREWYTADQDSQVSAVEGGIQISTANAYDGSSIPSCTPFYAKFTEMWDGSANAETDDAANSFTAIPAAHGFDDGSAINDVYYTATDIGLPKFLTRLTKLKAWLGYRLVVSWLQGRSLTSAVNNMDVMINNIVVYTTSAFSVSKGNLVHIWLRSKLALGLNTLWLRTFSLQQWADFGAPGIAQMWNGGTKYAQVFTCPAGDGKIYIQNFGSTPTGKVGNPTATVNIKLTGITGANIPNEADLKMQWLSVPWLPGDQHFLDCTSITLTPGVGYALIVEVNADGVSDAANYYAWRASAASVYSGGTACQKVGAGAWTTVPASDLAGQVKHSMVVFSEVKEIECVAAEDDQVILEFRNSLGGITSWGFTPISEVQIFYKDDGTKCKRLTVYAEDLTYEQYIALEDAIDLGEEFKIIEPKRLGSGSSADESKSSYRLSQYVYRVADKSDTPRQIPIMIQPSMNKTKTDQVQHRMTLVIEYPVMTPTK
jgi:hypothetical protein